LNFLSNIWPGRLQKSDDASKLAFKRANVPFHKRLT
jgi:hypothetical protein